MARIRGTGNSQAGFRQVPGKAGVMVDTQSGKLYDLSEKYEGNKYDTCAIGVGGPAIVPTALVGGQKLTFFRDLGGKDESDTNFTTPNHLDSGEELLLTRVGCYICTAFGDTLAMTDDIRKVAEAGYFWLNINKKLVAEGPLVFQPSGYGLSGAMTETDTNVVGIGVPSSAAAEKLVQKQLLTVNHTIQGYVQFHPRAWAVTGLFSTLAASMPTIVHPLALRMVLHGYIKAPATRG